MYSGCVNNDLIIEPLIFHPFITILCSLRSVKNGGRVPPRVCGRRKGTFHMKRIAIITGASSGMGELFAKTVCDHATLQEVWVIARRADRLEALRESVGCPLRVFALDLTDRSTYAVVSEALEAEKPEVSWLINASGYGKFCATIDNPLDGNLNMMDLNCGAVMAMCQTVIPYMPRGSHIINVASVAAFQPIPYINVYGATKAFTLHYSRGLNRELKGKGIAVTALCPFWTRTEFFNRAVNADKNAVVKKYVAMYEPTQIVRRAWRDAERGRDVSQYGFIARFQSFLAKILPHSLVMSVWMRQQKLH